ncbi:transcriptional regulator [Streptomyces anandii]|uniref:transcriptional regulator n=1 Tax=Streptomyces anandii TaxID=285454 RepID=UPI0037B0361F
MPERHIEFGRYGARGIKGHQAVARRLDSLAGFIASPVTTRRGRLARLRYLTRTQHARQAAREAGLTVTDRTLEAWLNAGRTPSRKNLERIETAYRTVRRQNTARHLLARLNHDGLGTRVEFHPLDQSQVGRPRLRAVTYRTLNVRHWDRIVRAWADDDEEALDHAWIADAVVDLGSGWGQYEYVTSIGFAA